MAIFEGAFIFEDVLIRVDVLKRNNDGTYDLIEVKSGTSLKKEHLPDCAIQTYVLQRLGFRIRNTSLMYLNNRYIRKEKIELSKLFIIECVNEKIQDELQVIPKYLDRISDVLLTNEEPFWQIGSICKNPYPCEFKNYCWKDISSKAIYSLSRISESQTRNLITIGVNLIRDIPEDFSLTNLQIIQATCEKKQSPVIDFAAIKDHLLQLQYPLYFLDFETYGYAIPQYEGTHPYQHMPFQYSLHVKQHPEAELEHYEFLFEKKENPSRTVAEHLIQHISSSGSVIVFYSPFESGRLEDMANQFPDLSHKLIFIKNRIWDLQTPFAKKWYCDPGFNGSASIKNVLTVLVPEMKYTELEIQKGDIAQLKYLELIESYLENHEREKIKNALYQYCALDTLAMVHILKALEAQVDSA
jgi:hypothetical protein